MEYQMQYLFLAFIVPSTALTTCRGGLSVLSTSAAVSLTSVLL